jgi:hypothetical protein
MWNKPSWSLIPPCLSTSQAGLEHHPSTLKQSTVRKSHSTAASWHAFTQASLKLDSKQAWMHSPCAWCTVTAHYKWNLSKTWVFCTSTGSSWASFPCGGGQTCLINFGAGLTISPEKLNTPYNQSLKADSPCSESKTLQGGYSYCLIGSYSTRKFTIQSPFFCWFYLTFFKAWIGFGHHWSNVCLT